MTSFTQLCAKLRTNNRKHYLLLFACIFFSVTLITSFAVIMQSRTVQLVLPEGGDSRKQMLMVFAIAVAGCGIFTTYASSLFFRFKSWETGVFMALGASRRLLRRVLYRELAAISLLGAGLGMLCGTPLSAGVWMLFRLLIIDSAEMRFSIDPLGYLWGVAFSLFVVLTLFLMGRRFLRRTDILAVVSEQRRSEPVPAFRAWYGWVGVLMIAAGGFGAFSLPLVYVQFLSLQPPFWPNLLYLLIPIGLYLLLVYLIVRGGGGRHPYRNIITRSMMKFQGRQTVRSMCVIALLIAGTYFAMFYIPATSVGALAAIAARPYDFAYRHRVEEPLPQREEVLALAREMDVEITQWQESRLVCLGVDGYRHDWLEDGTISNDYQRLISERGVLPLSDYNRISSKEEALPSGGYLLITPPEYSPTSDSYDEMITCITNPDTMAELPVAYQGQTVFSHLDSFLVLTDADFQRITAGASDEWREILHLFDVADLEASYPFAKRLRGELIARSGERSAVDIFYDRIVRRNTIEAGEEYWLDDPSYRIDYTRPDSLELNTLWTYAPQFRVLNRNDYLLNLSVYLMLFAFIAIICFAAVIVIAYTRCMTIGLGNRQVYDDLKHLGANRNYLYRSVRGQISKVFFIPALIGSVIIYLFFTMILYLNSGNLTPSELGALGINLALIAAASLVLWLFYRFTLRKVCALLHITR